MQRQLLVLRDDTVNVKLSGGHLASLNGASGESLVLSNRVLLTAGAGTEILAVVLTPSPLISVQI